MVRLLSKRFVTDNDGFPVRWTTVVETDTEKITLHFDHDPSDAEILAITDNLEKPRILSPSQLDRLEAKLDQLLDRRVV